MNRFPFYIFSGLVLGFLTLQTGCRDLENVTAPEMRNMIKSVIPAQAPYGARVMIGGTGFGSDPEEVQVYFDETKAVIESLSDSTILTRVPRKATSGPVKIITKGDTLTGPAFIVDTSRNLWLEVTGLDPASGGIGDIVTITGDGFSTDPEQNKVFFNETPARVNSASETSLTTVVPQEAQTGPVMVVVEQDTAVGPIFTVQDPRSLQVTVLTEGTETDPDGYVFSVSGQDDRSVLTNDEVVYNEIYDSEVQVTLSGVASNCRVEGENPRTMSLSTESMAGTTFTVDCTRDLRGYIVYTSDLNNISDIFVKDEASNEIVPITETADIHENNPVISPDGLQIAFDAYTETGSHVFVMDSDGSDIKQVTSEGYNRSPDWSPEGDRIVFEGGMEIMDIKITDLESGEVENITNTTDASERSPTWSPDVTEIAFLDYDGNDGEIYAFLTDGTGRRQVTDNMVFDSEPEWSPDGDKMVFLSENSDGSPVVNIINSDGSAPQELLNTAGAKSSVSWSPDGTKIALTMNYDGVDQIFIYSLEQEEFIHTPWIPGNDRAPHWNYR